ncbi:DMT family transporter [Elioraea sp.]|jgi:drug/metabolite transporter (DMT)-like permease|uniref:DMT family transporter n=1 Tax=Elioraea sp. TaxID=2185103 RepID=UPI0021DC50F2|nr:DMT family transporter [Elioraea sp.]GIX10850.1 MAG: multidrug ABC transporter permease [Elioraea sp.]
MPSRPQPRTGLDRPPPRGTVLPASPLALLLLAALGTIWGVTPAVGKLAVGGGIGPVGYALFYTAAAAAILAGIACARRESPPADAAALGFYLGAGLLGSAVPGTLVFVTLQHLPAGVLAMVIPASPLLTFLLAAAAGLERATRRRAGGVVLALAGTTLALSPGAVLPAGGSVAWAALSGLIPACYAASNLFAVRFRPPAAPPLVLAAGTLAASVLWLVPAALVFGQARLPGADAATALALIQGALQAAAYLIYFRLLTHQGGVFVSQVGYVIVLTGLFWGWVFFAEIPGALALPAAALIFAGLALATRPARPAPA